MKKTINLINHELHICLCRKTCHSEATQQHSVNGLNPKLNLSIYVSATPTTLYNSWELASTLLCKGYQRLRRRSRSKRTQGSIINAEVYAGLTSHPRLSVMR